jgi:anti-anti-sigma factor
VNSPLGQDPALLLKQEGAAMFGVDLSTRECDGHVVVVLCGQLDTADAADVAAALTAVAVREPRIIVDLAGLQFIDSSGVAALARGRKQARHAGGDLLLAAPQHQVLRVLTLTRLIDVFPVHTSVDDAARSAGRSRRAAAPAAGRPARVAVT